MLLQQEETEKMQTVRFKLSFDHKNDKHKITPHTQLMQEELSITRSDNSTANSLAITYEYCLYLIVQPWGTI